MNLSLLVRERVYHRIFLSGPTSPILVQAYAQALKGQRVVQSYVRPETNVIPVSSLCDQISSDLFSFYHPTHEVIILLVFPGGQVRAMSQNLFLIKRSRVNL